MKVTKEYLKHVIKEELNKVLEEGSAHTYTMTDELGNEFKTRYIDNRLDTITINGTEMHVPRQAAKPAAKPAAPAAAPAKPAAPAQPAAKPAAPTQSYAGDDFDPNDNTEWQRRGQMGMYGW